MRVLFVAAALLLTYASAFGFTRDYVPTGQLTPADEKIILQLLKARGIENVAVIRTYYVVPSPWVGIMITEAERRVGNTVRFRMASLSKQGWYEELGGDGPTSVLGAFTLRRVVPQEREVFTVNTNEYHLELQGGISRPDAEKILRLLLAGKVEYRTSRREQLAAFDLLNPVRMEAAKDGQHYHVGFNERHADAAWCDFTIMIEDDRIVVTEISIVVA